MLKKLNLWLMIAIVFCAIAIVCGLMGSSWLAKRFLSDEADDLSIPGLIAALKEKDSDRVMSVIILLVHASVAAFFLFVMYFVAGSLLATKVQTTQGTVVDKFWQQKHGTRIITVGKVPISQPYTYDEYVLTMDDGSGRKNIIVDMEIYAKIEEGQRARIVEYANIFGEHLFRIE